MSITGEIDRLDSPIAGFMRERLPNHRLVQKRSRELLAHSETMAPPSVVGYPFALVGMAFDYRVRFGFAPTPLAELRVAVDGLERLCQERGGQWRRRLARLTEDIDRLIADSVPSRRAPEVGSEDQLARLCFALAMFDAIGRGFEPNPLIAAPTAVDSLESLLAAAPAHAVDDLVQLYDRFWAEHGALTHRPVVLNPVFSGSPLIPGGADADLIVDGCLIEVKVLGKPALRREHVLQLAGYILLDADDDFCLDSAAIYMARQGVMLSWSTDELFSLLSGQPSPSLHELRVAFLKAVQATRTLRLQGRFRRPAEENPPADHKID